jgi:hypothetical protein
MATREGLADAGGAKFQICLASLSLVKRLLGTSVINVIFASVQLYGGEPMTKTVLVSFAILTLATSTALAATKSKPHHQAAKPTAAAPAASSPGMGMTPGFGIGGPSKADHDMYLKNQRDAGLAGKK